MASKATVLLRSSKVTELIRNRAGTQRPPGRGGPAMERERDERRPELEAAGGGVAEREGLEGESKKLASAAAEAKTGRQGIYARLGELHVTLEAKEREEAQLQAELEGLDGDAVDGEELRRSIEEFGELWEELFPGEKVRMIGLLLESVEYEARAGEVRLKFRVEAPTA